MCGGETGEVVETAGGVQGQLSLPQTQIHEGGGAENGAPQQWAESNPHTGRES